MPEITKNDEIQVRSVPIYIWAAFAALTVFVYFFGLDIPFLGPDEARYAQVAREMFLRGDLVTPTLGGFEWFEKPALLYWLEIASYKIFGVSEFAARLGSALFGLGTLAALWLLGRSASKVKGGDADGGLANWLALVAASTVGLLVFARGASFDIVITFPITAALVSFFIWHSESEGDAGGAATRPRGTAALLSFYIFTGIAILAKGLIGILFPFAIVGLFYVLSRRRPSRIFLISLVWGTLLAAAVASTWYLPMYQLYGYRFIDEFFVQHHFQRFTSNKYQHPQPFFFFLWVLPLMTLPWLPFFAGALSQFVKRLFRRVPASPRPAVPPSPLLLFSIAWLVVPLGFFSLSGSKLPGYVLPALPGAMVLTAIYVHGLTARSSRWRTAILAVAGGTLITVIVVVRFALPGFADTDSVRSLVAAADAHGFAANRVLTLHTISYNAEFYAAGRLVRDENGRQKRLSTISEVLAETSAENGRPVLVLVPVEYASQLQREVKLNTEVIKDNGELAIAVVSLR